MEDEAGFYRQPTAGSQWSPAGREQPRMKWSCRSNKCLRAAVALDVVSGRIAHRLASSFCVSALAQAYRSFFKAWPEAEQIFLVMDNWPNHFHPGAWKAVEEDSRVRVLWLPTYAPWLNPAEKIWKWLRQTLTHMHPYADDFPALRQAIDQALLAASVASDVMLRYTGTGKSKLYYS